MTRAVLCNRCGVVLDPALTAAGDDRHPRCHTDPPTDDAGYVRALHVLAGTFPLARRVRPMPSPAHTSRRTGGEANRGGGGMKISTACGPATPQSPFFSRTERGVYPSTNCLVSSGYGAVRGRADD